MRKHEGASRRRRPGRQVYPSWQAVTASAATDFRSSTSVVHVCTSAACSAATIVGHSGLYCGEFESDMSQLGGGLPMVGHASLIDCLSSSVVVIADCNDVHAFVTLPSESKAAEICLADVVSGTSVLEKEESDTCGKESQDRLIRT